MRPRPSSGGYAKHILLVNWSNRTKLRGDHCKLEKDEDTEMLNPGDSEMHDSVTGPIRSQHHDSSGGKAHGADYLLENVKNPLRQPPSGRSERTGTGSMHTNIVDHALRDPEQRDGTGMERTPDDELTSDPLSPRKAATSQAGEHMRAVPKVPTDDGPDQSRREADAVPRGVTIDEHNPVMPNKQSTTQKYTGSPDREDTVVTVAAPAQSYPAPLFAMQPAVTAPPEPLETPSPSAEPYQTASIAYRASTSPITQPVGATVALSTSPTPNLSNVEALAFSSSFAGVAAESLQAASPQPGLLLLPLHTIGCPEDLPMPPTCAKLEATTDSTSPIVGPLAASVK
ncbi:hypothetical protein LTR01_008531 [Friedmanniomyces endolithicus]|nr:hypothetical protein LTS09_017656 [Friedmanniomyces endolithicus]KAK0302764.1 hypothetical protein LTR01_008531 [Friedmanniomyces endolithicus]